MEFWCENVDLGVFDIADFKFLGPKSKFERNGRNWFSSFQNQFPGPKIPNRNGMLGFEVPISHFPETQIFENRNFKFWQSRFLYFHQNLSQIFDFEGSIYQNFPRISLSTRNNYFSNFSSTYDGDSAWTWRGPVASCDLHLRRSRKKKISLNPFH